MKILPDLYEAQAGLEIHEKIPTQAKVGLEWGTFFSCTYRTDPKKKPHFWQNRPEVGHPACADSF
jgi:hypothetical protein